MSDQVLAVADVRDREAVGVVVPRGAVLRPAAALVEPPGARIGVKYPQRRLGIPGCGDARERGRHQPLAHSSAPDLWSNVNLPDLSDKRRVLVLVAGRRETG